MNRTAVFLVILALASAPNVHAETPVPPTHDRVTLEQKWRARIQTLLDQGKIPLIDLESSLPRQEGSNYLPAILPIMDEIGMALIAFDGYQAHKDGSSKGYRWGYYINEVVNAHPDRFILATNGGTNPNWLKQGSDFIAQTEQHVKSGEHLIMGEFEFRHYMSSTECKEQRTERDVAIPLTSENGHRLFRLSAETGIAFVIHLEPEDAPLDQLEEMLGKYPKAQVIVAHFGQIRHPEKQTQFTPERARHLLKTYPNLFYDLSVGEPGRRYKCNAGVLDTVLWERSGLSQKDTLKPEYKAILTEFSTRFVAGTDYGNGRAPLPGFLRERVSNLRLIMRDLPDEAKHNIGYRNAWRLLTGKPW